MQSNMFLDTPIGYLKGVGPQRASALKSELKIFTFFDLINYFPFRYVDRTKFYLINQLHSDLPYVQVVGVITSIELLGTNRSQRLVAQFQDKTGSIELVWFKGIKWIREKYKIGVQYVVFGKINEFNNRLNISHPEIELLTDFKNARYSQLDSVYNSTEKLKNIGLDSKGIYRLQKTLISQIDGHIVENLNSLIIEKFRFPNRVAAYKQIHFPESETTLTFARNRFKFEELFYVQLDLLDMRKQREGKDKGFVFPLVGEYFHRFYKLKLPFELTGAQKRVIKEIRADLGKGRQMNRLLQGDVGSGKTLVALMSMLIAIDNGFQACLMAPTEILALQHYETLCQLLEGIGIDICMLTGSVKISEKRKRLEKIKNAEVKLIVGTHALIEETVVFNNLGLVVIDEQHKFGVAQRAMMWKKNYIPPHILVMTATPIPRTLAMTLFGDLDTSVIDELPPGRKPIITLHKTDLERHKLIYFIREQIKIGRQIYVVYPLIEESKKLDLKDLNEGYENLIREFPLSDYAVAVVHGQMKQEDREIEMQRFSSGKANILVATTVIEVGVNVPNASVMVIENAERFGLSQLHQLRGRVGRGADQSYCILMTKEKLSADAKKRMHTMVSSNDGFKIAEVDLEIRGPGDVAGTQQSGVNNFNIADLKHDFQILNAARMQANEILEKDPSLDSPENSILKNNLIKYRSMKPNWSKIS